MYQKQKMSLKSYVDMEELKRQLKGGSRKPKAYTGGSGKTIP
jgi:hypothetical protein